MKTLLLFFGMILFGVLGWWALGGRGGDKAPELVADGILVFDSVEALRHKP